MAKDSINGAHVVEYFAMIAAWVGDKQPACDQLAILTRIPGTISYGQLKLLPYWDPLRGDPACRYNLDNKELLRYKWTCHVGNAQF